MVVRCEYMCSINKEIGGSEVQWKYSKFGSNSYQINQNCEKHKHSSNHKNSLQSPSHATSPYAKQHLKTQLVKWRFLDQEVAVKDGLAVRENVVLKTLLPGAIVLSLITSSRYTGSPAASGLGNQTSSRVLLFAISKLIFLRLWWRYRPRRNQPWMIQVLLL